MFENLFRVGFTLAIVLPPLAVLAGLVLLVVPRFHAAARVTHTAVHP